MSSHARVVPWSGISEWRYVADRIFSDDPSTVQHALSIATVWCLRGSHPPAVESTVNLLTLKRDTAALQSPHAALALGSSLVRFVNEVVDAGQKGTYALPVTHLAEKANISRLLVDIRHSVTHDQLPSLETLLLGVDLALDWLKQYYWEPQRNYELAVRDATAKMLERFSEGLKDCDPMKKPIEVHAARCIRDVHHVEYSPEIQKPFLVTLIESPYPNSTILPVATALAIKDPEIVLLLIEIAQTEKLMIDRISLILETAAFQIRDSGIVGRCARRCFGMLNETGNRLMRSVLKTQRSILPDDLAATIEVLLSTRPKTAMTTGQLLEKTEAFISMSTAATEKSPVVDEWSRPKNWKPCPFGMTSGFNPMTQFSHFVVE
ncbi:Las1-like [Paramicrosporidium saccamoebae]|uniref:Las1-like n=1 Tax=Paramicrosporidium saccamoebae TaxID=1246581 RepID=A0A2H9TMI9_9FUNG|nr:Las1-like [Paramicrosporidium saccamoebae]